ncbi:MAG: glycoside hydrolase family 3 N-terminal domain-containing protein [Rhodoferax sp.]
MNAPAISADAPYKNAALPVDARVRDLLVRMTLAEKVAQLHGHWLLLDEGGEHRVRPGPAFLGSSDATTLRQRLALGVGHITRPQGTHGVEAARGLRALNRLQRYLKHETRLGIPALAHEECLVGLMARDGTLFPSALGLSATWNPAMVEAVAAAIGAECRAVGCHLGLAPVLDVSRDVRWGRTEETLGEDPYLVGVLGAAYVRGLQGPSRDMLAALKHFAGHSFSEGARNHAPVNVGWRALNDVFLLPFEMAVKLANAGAVMPAYHDIDGEPCHASHHLLTQVLRDAWNFDGLIVADYGGISLLYQHHGVANDAIEAAALAFNAGLDAELPGDDCAKQIATAIEREMLSHETLDTIVTRVLRLKFQLGLFDQSFEDPSDGPALRMPAALDVALEAARQAIVVLDNRGDVLPLDPARTPRVALIGPTADDPLALLSAYSYPAHVVMHNERGATDHIVTPRAAMERMYGSKNLVYSQGCGIIDERKAGTPVFPGDLGTSPQLQQSPVSVRTDGISAAAEAARSADVALVCLGDLAGMFQTGTVGEGSDTDSLALPGVQQQLLEAVVATGTPTVAILMSGRPYDLGGVETRLAAYVMAFAGGQQGGLALADVIAGIVPPSGRLTVSLPKSAGGMPYFYNHKLKSAGTPIAFHFGSRFAFGHGLSLTRFEYRHLEMASDRIDIDGELLVSFEVANIGPRYGVDIPQLYVRDCQASVVRPVHELKAFARVKLYPGQAARITWRVPLDMLGFTGPDGTRIVEPGWFDLAVGASSADLRLRTRVQAVGSCRRLPQCWRMTSGSHIALVQRPTPS